MEIPQNPSSMSLKSFSKIRNEEITAMLDHTIKDPDVVAQVIKSLHILFNYVPGASTYNSRKLENIRRYRHRKKMEKIENTLSSFNVPP